MEVEVTKQSFFKGLSKTQIEDEVKRIISEYMFNIEFNSIDAEFFGLLCSKSTISVQDQKSFLLSLN